MVDDGHTPTNGASENRVYGHNIARKRAYDLLDRSRAEAAKSGGHSSIQFRLTIQAQIRDRFDGKEMYDWQLDVAESLCLGVDTFLIAGTGEGKTLPFIAPLLRNDKAMILVISPLNALEEDQAQRFNSMGLSAVPVNGDTWGWELQLQCEERAHRVLLTSPELALRNHQFRKMLSTPSFSNDIGAVIVDEAHCIFQWGGLDGFREGYGLIGDLRALLPSTVPFLAVTATASPQVQAVIMESLLFNPDRTFYLNLGNDRHNITYGAIRMTTTAADFSSLKFVVTSADTSSIYDITPKTMVFCNVIKKTHAIAQYLRELLPLTRRGEIAVYHALRTPRAKRRVMRRFRKGKIRVLITTEAAGMGADIPDVSAVVQYGVPSSLSVWLQRAGRAARNPTIQGRATLLVEKSVFTRIKINAKKSKTTNNTNEPQHNLDIPEDDDSDSELSSDENSDSSNSPLAGSGVTWRFQKAVDIPLRQWIETLSCRLLIADKHFDNPPARRARTAPCCDNCEGLTRLAVICLSRPSTPQTRPDQRNTTASSPSTPAQVPNANGKRRMNPTPAIRRDDRLAAVKTALLTWREDTWRFQYAGCDFLPAAFLSTAHILKISSNTRIVTLADLARELKPRWVFLKKFGGEVLDVVKEADDKWLAEKQRAADAKKATKAAETARKANERKQRRADDKHQEVLRREGEKAAGFDIIQYVPPNHIAPQVLQPSVYINLTWQHSDVSSHH